MDTLTIILIAAGVLPWLLFLIVRSQKAKLLEQIKDTQRQLTSTATELSKLKEKYGPIQDIEKHCLELEDEAAEHSLALKSEAEKIVAKAENSAASIIANAKQAQADTSAKIKALKEKAELIKQNAISEAKKTISFAEEQAQEIAGNAYEAKSKADVYEKAIRAMRNTIEGYKDDYIIPNHSLLDDLADEYSHKSAGEEFKKSRQRVRALIKEGRAGECDYAEAHRKTYAIHFAVDAFNGKVDSALAKVKHDNFGKIQQEIIDAFALVNHNGAPFRNARITQEFLDARLTELQWAVRAFELRNIEKREQAEIKAQIREEERAIREMEKAQKEAAKEERMLQKALEKARLELKQASDAQRAQYEAQLSELEEKLHEAEEKGQRALSMAQQTRRGHVYVISNIGSFGEQVFKIGMTRRLEPMDRVKELGDASVPFSFDVHAMIYSEDAPNLEKELHNHFHSNSVNKVNPRKEFFKTSITDIKAVVDTLNEEQVHWTLKAEASEFRESLSIEKEQQYAAIA